MMAQALRLVGACQYLAGLLTPWRPAYRVSASPSRCQFFVTARDVVGRHISKYGAHESALTAWISDYLAGFDRDAGIVVDVGANLGWHTVHAAKAPAAQCVVAYEPDAFNAWLLDRNIEQNSLSNVIVNTVAVGASAGTAKLNSYKASNKGRHSLAFSHGGRVKQVPLVALDTSLRDIGQNGPILLMKIDVEGYEPEVLAGARQALERTSAVIMEFDPASTLGGPLSPDRSIALLTEAFFEPHTLGENGLLESADFNGLRAASKQVELIWMKRHG